MCWLQHVAPRMPIEKLYGLIKQSTILKCFVSQIGLPIFLSADSPCPHVRTVVTMKHSMSLNLFCTFIAGYESQLSLKNNKNKLKQVPHSVKF